MKINDEIPIYWKGDSGPNLVCLHGAGHSAMSFAPLAGLVGEKYRLISFDFRGHGSNTLSGGEDLSQDTLVSDTIKVLQFISQEFANEVIILVGHSMGGSIATKTCAEIFKNDSDYPELNEKIMGLIVIDVVEGTAMEALPFMENIVETRPSSFKTIEQGIEYMYKSNTIKNLESARISVPSLFKETTNKKGEKVFAWKTNLMASQKYWTEWFLNLTKSFLSIRIPKILLLAGSDRMDKDLTIAQMQGKFKLCVLNDVGHIIQEDDPKGVNNLINNFITTFKIPANVTDFKPIVGKLGNSSAKNVKYDETNYIMK
jgi:protein phosphatase methylesterase 1